MLHYYFSDLSVLLQNLQIYQQLVAARFLLTLPLGNTRNHRQNFKTTIYALSKLKITLMGEINVT